MKRTIFLHLKFIAKEFISSLSFFPSAQLPQQVDITFDHTKTHISLFAPATGKLKCLNDVIDKVYSTKTLGDGFAITPTNGKVCAPINGEIVSVFPTKHAIGIRDEHENDYLLHMGIGTVDLNGHGFKSFIKQHQKIRVGDVLAIMDLPYILQHNKITDIVFVALSKENIDSIELKESAPVAINDEIAKIIIK